MVIYKAINNINGKVYIGQTINTLDFRKRKHIERAMRGEGQYFQNALRKYGAKSFVWQAINECYDIDTLNQLEKYYISYYESTNKEYGYNLEGGGKNNTVSEETREKCRQANSGKSNPNYGKPRSDETKKKIGLANSGKNNGMYGMTGKKNPMYGVRFYGENNHNYGKKWTQEQKDKQSIREKKRQAKNKV